jgi:hypothetical protein
MVQIYYIYCLVQYGSVFLINMHLTQNKLEFDLILDAGKGCAIQFKTSQMMRP